MAIHSYYVCVCGARLMRVALFELIRQRKKGRKIKRATPESEQYALLRLLLFALVQDGYPFRTPMLLSSCVLGHAYAPRPKPPEGKNGNSSSFSIQFVVRDVKTVLMVDLAR